MRVREARVAPRYKVPAAPAYQHYTFPAPIRGWVASESLALAQPGAAIVLENWRPTQTGVVVRGGSTRHATVSARVVETLMSYKSGSTAKLFASSDGSIYDITTPASPAIPPDPSVESQTADYYSSALFSTVGGDYLIAANGADTLLSFDGALWRRIDDSTHELSYDGGTGDFTVGQTITGGTSAATAVIVSISGTTAAGTLRINTVSGVFQDNEALTDGSTGSATVNGTLVSIPSITGVDTSEFIHVWPYRNRLFFVQAATKSAWYLPVDAVGGSATELTLDGVFRRGGTMLMGATWSLDAGDGLDDKCVFVSSQGEVAVYEGSNPADANDWRLVGRYDMDAPLGRNATMQAGGDLIILTKSGGVPLSQVMQKDPAALSLSAITRNIEPVWKQDAISRGSRPWEIAKWPEKNIAVVSVPGQVETWTPSADWGEGIWGEFVWGGANADRVTDDPYCFIVNLETGAWAKYTGWDVQCLAYHEGELYFGTADGKIKHAEQGGTDDGAVYVARYAGLFETLGAQSVVKRILQARPTFTYSQDFNAKSSVSINYTLTWPTAPSSAANATTAGVWDAAEWDASSWDTPVVSKVRANWVSIGRTGYAISPMIQVTSGTTVAPDAELVSMDVTFETGKVVV